jgi:MFS family permease
VALALALFMLAIVPTMGVALPAGVLVGAAAFGFFASANSVVQVRTDPAMRGRVLALQAIVVVGGTPIFGPVIGVITDGFGPRVALGLGAATCAGAALFGTRVRRRQPPEPPDGTAETPGRPTVRSITLADSGGAT